MPDSEETLFKQQIQPAEWVSPKQAEMAKQVYSECLEKYRKIKCGDMDFPSDIVPYEVRLKAIENLVTKKDFKNFWIKANEYYVINIVSGLYTRYFGPDEKNLRPIITKITKTEKDRRLDEAAKLLKDFCRKIDSDQSLKTCFQAAFVDALEAGSLKPNNPYNESAFFNKLYESLSDPGPNGCRRMKTHTPYPRSMNEGDKAERGRFSYGVSMLVKHIYGRFNHAMASKILNVLRPDLGNFSADNVRIYMKRRNAQ